MAVALFGLASAVAAVASFLIFTTAKSAIHEILGVALGLVSAIFGVGSVAIYHLDRLPERIAKALEARVSTPPRRDDEILSGNHVNLTGCYAASSSWPF
jgi:hypothetical protein